MNESVFLVLPSFIIIAIIKKNWVNKWIKPLLRQRIQYNHSTFSKVEVLIFTVKFSLKVLSKQPGKQTQKEWLSHNQSPGLFDLPPRGMLEDLQQLWGPGALWQPHFPSSSGQGDKEASSGACQLEKAWDPNSKNPLGIERLNFICV